MRSTLATRRGSRADFDEQARTGVPDAGADEQGAIAPSPAAQCADGQDNDSDGKVDLADPGCVDASDNNEADDPPPTTTTTPAYHPACEPTCDADLKAARDERDQARAERDALQAKIDAALEALNG